MAFHLNLGGKRIRLIKRDMKRLFALAVFVALTGRDAWRLPSGRIVTESIPIA
jgi:hypothetical protein